jgi:hypothetical protein
MEAAMANITIDSTWTGGNGNSLWDHVTHRLQVLVRARRIGRHRAARLRLIHTEMRDPRWFADIGVDVKKHRRSDWIGEMARGMGGRP